MSPKKNEKKKAVLQKSRLSGEIQKTIPSPSDSDPLGMYTGKPTEDEMPTQDADDL